MTSGNDFRIGQSAGSGKLLGPHDPPTVKVHNPQGLSAFLLIGDHAGRVIPKALDDLGLDETQLSRHIALDIGVAALGEALAARLDAAFIAQTYSRLVIDCNRDPSQPTAIAQISDGTTVPGNAALSAEQRGARIAEIHEPYQLAIAGVVAQRRRERRPTVLISLHSFTPTMGGIDRPWDIGVLHDGGELTFADAMLRRLRRDGSVVVGDNEPYRMDCVDHTVPRHAYEARLPYVELEIRQDHLATRDGIIQWADRLETWLTDALAETD